VLDPLLLAPHALARGAADHPDRVAVQHVDGDTTTYAQLHADALRWAGALASLGVDAGHHVATMLPNGPAAQRAMLGLAWLRAVECPLNTAYVGEMLRHALDLVEATVLVTTAELSRRVVPLLHELPALHTIVLVDGTGVIGFDGPPGTPVAPRVVSAPQLLHEARPAVGLPGPAPHDLAALLFTSGTTGPSKAVRTPWPVVYQFWSWVPDDTVGPDEGLFCALPLFHNSGRSAFNYALSRGARLVWRDKFSATHFWDDVRRTGCATAAIVGPMTALLHQAPRRPDDADNPLRSVILGPMIREMADFEARFGVAVATCYGQTEVGIPIATGWDHGPWAGCGKVRETYPFPEVRLVDEHDEPVAQGEVGEMIVRTREPWGLNLGYHRMPEATVAAWRNGWFHTGDAFRQDDDGWFFFVDRMRDTIRRRGENISSFEVEQLVATHPDVIECAAIGVPTELGDDEVMVVVVVAEPDAFDAPALLAHLDDRMPRYMLPRYVEAVADLPRNQTTQRVLKHELRARGVTDRTWDREAS
jgi:carnitine-CoA ligase